MTSTPPCVRFRGKLYLRTAATLEPLPEKTWSGGTQYQMRVLDDMFIHFTPHSRAQEIIRSGKLLMNPPYKKFGIDAVVAVSLHYGDLKPRVQLTHIDAKDEPIAAVVFQTPTLPKIGYVEEVIWDKDVDLVDPMLVTAAEGEELLQNTPQKITGDDTVKYI